jgi:hypothetical protein
MPNFLFHNLRNGRFEELAMETGVALPDTGTEMSAMGAEFRDFDNDGWPDIAVTALAGETFPLFRNTGKGTFREATYESRIGQISRVYSGWSIGMCDFDNDGWKDIFTANAHVSDRVELFEATQYKQHDSVFRNVGAGRFEDVSASAGLVGSVRAHRGAAFADFNNDGRIDVVASSLGETPEIWRNATPNSNGWLIVKLRGTRSNRDGIGAVVRTTGQTNHMTTSVGYASSSDFGVHFGTGQRKLVEELEIRWPSGVRQVLRNVKTNQVIEAVEPDQRAPPSDARTRR